MPALFRLAVCAIDRPEPVPEAESPVLANCLAAVREAAERGADLVLLSEEPDIIAGGASGAELGPLIAAEIARWSAVAKKANIKQNN